MNDSREIDTILNPCLSRLGINQAEMTDYRQVKTGGSGAAVIEVHVKNEPFILKFTPCEADRDLYESARCELRFYERIAPYLNIRVPRSIGSFEDSTFGIGVCMHALKPTPAPSAWEIGMVKEAITQIASLHAAYWGREGDIGDIIQEKEQRQRFEHRDDEIEKSVEAWVHVYTVMNERKFVPPIALENMIMRLRDIGRLSDMESEAPCTLVHGDFHMENCLISNDGKITIADWQSIGKGAGPAEIGYFIARSELYGNPISSGEIIENYIELLNGGLSTPVSHTSIERIIHAKRLSTHLFWSARYVLYWPEFVLYRVLEAIADSSQRLRLV